MRLNEIIWIVILFFFILLVPYRATSKMIKVAVIDSGFNTEYTSKVKLCSTGHTDFTGEGFKPNSWHGTHVSGLIEIWANKANYCQIILKYYITGQESEKITLKNMVKAINKAIELKVDVINISGGGNNPDLNEYNAIKTALDKGIKVIVAAGNQGRNLHKKCNYFPACYNDGRIIVVGNIDNKGSRAPSSNHGGTIDAYVTGVSIHSINDIIATGTSQSTAIYTGTFIRGMK